MEGGARPHGDWRRGQPPPTIFSATGSRVLPRRPLSSAPPAPAIFPAAAALSLAFPRHGEQAPPLVFAADLVSLATNPCPRSWVPRSSPLPRRGRGSARRRVATRDLRRRLAFHRQHPVPLTQSREPPDPPWRHRRSMWSTTRRPSPPPPPPGAGGTGCHGVGGAGRGGGGAQGRRVHGRGLRGPREAAPPLPHTRVVDPDSTRTPSSPALHLRVRRRPPLPHPCHSFLGQPSHLNLVRRSTTIAAAVAWTSGPCLLPT